MLQYQWSQLDKKLCYQTESIFFIENIHGHTFYLVCFLVAFLKNYKYKIWDYKLY